ncbi:MAG: hypothetical protein VB070_00805 [Clostridiaceae bacterium]|nr:hypothetical protein [Clostridiaceae bacterium]
MKRMKTIRRLAAILAAACLWILLLQVGIRFYKNRQIVSEFSYNAYQQQYQRAVPVDEMDFNEYRRYFTQNETANKLAVNNRVSLPVHIRYYTKQDEKMILSFEIPKGTSVFWTASDAFYGVDAGYGICGYPTYERGWRYARPFITTNQNTDIKQIPYYFVRTDDLDMTAKAIITENENLRKSIKSQGLSISDAGFVLTRYIDYIFYDRGVFCSPDLQQSVCRWTDLVWLFLFFLALAAVVYSSRKLKQHTLLISRQNEIMETGTNR